MLGPKMQGEWTLYVSAFTLGSIALSFGLPPALNHYLAAKKIEKKLLISQFFVFTLSITLFFIALLFIVKSSSLKSVFLPNIGNLNSVLLGLSLHLFFLIFNQLIVSALLANKLFAQTARIAVYGAISLFGLYAILYFLDQNTVQEYFYFLVGINLFVLLGQSILYLKEILKDRLYTLKFSFVNMNLAKLLLGFALLAYVTNFLQFLNYKMDIWFIRSFVEQETHLGMYAIAVSLGQLIWLIPNAFHTVIFTTISDNKNLVESKAKIFKWSKYIFILAVILAFVGYLLSIWLIPVLFGADYSYITSIFPYLLPGIVCFAPTILWSAYLAGKGRIDINFKASLIGFVAALIFNVLFIPTYGVVGAAAATSVSYFVSGIYAYYQFGKIA